MIIPGGTFLFALSYLIGVDDYNIFMILKKQNDVVAVIMYLTLCYSVGTVISNLGSIITFLLKKFYKTKIEDIDKEIKDVLVGKFGYSDDFFKGKKSNNEYSKERILSTASRILRTNPRYNRINVFLSLIAISKSMFIVVFLITIIQLCIGKIAVGLYLINLVLLIVLGQRCIRMWGYYNKYIRDYFLMSVNMES